MLRLIDSKLIRRFILVASLACSVCAFSKDKDKGKESNSEIKFTSRSELVLIPAVITDKSGNHITGLKKEDFTVFENGSERQISTFEEITSDPRRFTRPSNPNQFSNFSGDGESNRRVTLIVLDLINTPFTDQAYARKELLKYLTQSVDRREPTGLYTLNRSGVHVVHDFTTDPRVLIAALHKVKGDTSQLVDTPEDLEAITGSASPEGSAGVDPGTVQSEADRLQTMMEDAELNFQSFQQRIAITYTLDGMQELAHALAGFAGRKSLIWAGGGFPFSVSDNTMQLAPAGRDSLTDVLPLYERTWQLLNDAQIALYPVDVKGLASFTPPASIRNPSASNRRPGGYYRSASWRQIDTQATLQTFAAATGGRAYYNSNDLVNGFRDAVHDSSEYYMLGYYLERSNTKSGWRKLSVKVKREHVEVRARNGFFVTHATVDPESSRDNDLASALKSPLDFTALSLVAHWDTTEASKDAGKKQVSYIVAIASDPTLIDAAPTITTSHWTSLPWRRRQRASPLASRLAGESTFIQQGSSWLSSVRRASAIEALSIWRPGNTRFASWFVTALADGLDRLLPR
ncbi:MAG TPA: VWA domain-containing protein [Candidatus Solibacter sp.]|nr:VWA domain-containing protein [Candidatus Solibacter sp.]